MKHFLLFGCMLLGCIIVSVPGVNAQSDRSNDVSFTHFNVANGLPENSAFALLQDRDGFLWIGTQNGLAKYDGENITTYKPARQDSFSLGGRLIRELLEARDGTLWIGTLDAGLYRFNRNLDQFIGFRSDSANVNTINEDRIVSLYEDADGFIWAGTRTGLNKLDPKTGFVERYLPEVGNVSALQDGAIQMIRPAENGKMWIATGNGLHLFDSKTGLVDKYYGLEQSLPFLDVNDVLPLDDGTVWLALTGALVHYDPVLRSVLAKYDYTSGLSSATVYRIHQSLLEPNILWIGLIGNDMSAGLNRLNTDNGQITIFNNDPTDPNSASGNIYTSFTESENTPGQIWMGSYGGGVDFYDDYAMQVTNLSHNVSDENGLPAGQITAIHEEDSGDNSSGNTGQIWTSIWEKGLYHLDLKTQEAISVLPDDNQLGNSITTIISGPAENLWLGTYHGLMRFNPQTNETQTWTSADGLPDDAVSTVFHSQTIPDQIWIGTNAGLASLDLLTDKITLLGTASYEVGKLPRSRIQQIMEVAELPGILWIQMAGGGIFRYNPVDQSAEAVYPLGDYTGIRAFLHDSEGRMWIGTHTWGIFQLDASGEIKKEYNESNGLIHDSVSDMLADKEGSIWVLTGRGVVRFTPKDSLFRRFEVLEGFSAGGSQYSATHVGQSGRLYFGGGNGLTYFDPADYSDNNISAKVALTDLKIFGHSVPVTADDILTQNIAVTQKITLAHWQNDISIHFASPTFRQNHKQTVQFQLIDYDDTWRDPTTANLANYTNLEAGNYTFMVRSINNDGLVSDQITTLQIQISPPWWKTIWAYIFYTIFVISAFFAVIKWRTRTFEQRAKMLEDEVLQRTKDIIKQKDLIEESRQKITEQADQLRELDKMKSAFFANISHEFRTPLSLILGPLEDALAGGLGKLRPEVEHQISDMRRQAQRLLHLVNQLLDLSKLEAKGMKLQPAGHDLSLFVRTVGLAFASMADRQEIAYTVPDPSPENLILFDADKLEKVLINLLSNAFKFTPAGGKISLGLKTTNSEFSITVTDTGAGIPEAALPIIFDRFRQADSSTTRRQTGSGIGLALVKEFVQLHGGTVSVESKEGQGSSFTVMIPLVSAGGTKTKTVKEFGIKPIQRVLLSSKPQFVSTLFDQTVQEVSVQTDTKESKETVLIVEDHFEVRQYLKSHLEKNYHILEAENGEIGFKMAKEHHPALVISDVMMPEMDGFDLCKQLKSDPTLNDIPVILVTARASDESKTEGFETGADDYIYKPFNAADLMIRAENLIEVRKMLRRRFSGEIVFHPGEISVPAGEEVFLSQVRDTIIKHLDNYLFGVELLADEVGISPRQLQRRLKKILNLSPAGLIRSMRLERAVDLLEAGFGNVSEVAFAVGFNDPKHFSKVFRQVFGKSPSQFTSKPERDQAKIVLT